jgi:hypothetical protein
MPLSDELARELQQKAEARIKRLFAAKGTFRTDNYRPPTGIGLFNFNYEAGRGTVEVQVKAAFKFLDHGVGNQANYIDWKHSEKQEFKAKALQVCHDAWSNKYRFRCTRPGWGEYQASVDISMVESAPDSAHYIIECRKVPKTDSSAWSGGCTHGASIWPYTANFSNWGVEKRTDFGGGNIFNFKEKQLAGTLKQSLLSVIAYGDTAEAVDVNQRTRLLALAGTLGRIISSDVTGIHCLIYGFSRTAGGFFSKGLGERRAIALQNLLNGHLGGGSFFKSITSTEGRTAAENLLRQQGKNPAAFEGVCLLIAIPSGSKRIVPTNYIVITHEFGHMLGCPDEYTGINCTGIKALMELDEIVPNTFARPLLNSKNFVPLGPNQHFLNETMTDSTAENVQRLQKQQKMFAYQIEQAGVSSPFFMSQQNTLNEAQGAEAQEA